MHKHLKKWFYSMYPAISARELRITFPTLVTLLRIVITPFIVSAMVTQRWDSAFFLFILAAVSDVVDGGLARWTGEQTLLGSCLDPVADKILVISCFFTLAFVQSPLFHIPLWFVMCVLIKELLLLIGVSYLFLRKGPIRIKPTLLGKCTMLMQVGFIVWLFACYFFAWVPVKTYYSMLGILLFFVIASFMDYLVKGYRYLYGV